MVIADPKDKIRQINTKILQLNKMSYKQQNIQSGLYTFICIDNENYTPTSPKALTTKIKQKQEKNNYLICEEIDKENPKENQLFYVYKDDDGY